MTDSFPLIVRMSSETWTSSLRVFCFGDDPGVDLPTWSRMLWSLLSQSGHRAAVAVTVPTAFDTPKCAEKLGTDNRGKCVIV